MPNVSVSVPHDHSPEDIVKRAEPLVEKLVSDFEGKDLEMEWNGNNADFHFKSLAFTIKGRLAVDEEKITVDIDLPFAAMMFKDKVQKGLTKALTRAVSDEPATEQD